MGSKTKADAQAWLLRGGRVVDPKAGRDGHFDIRIENGCVAAIDKNLPADGATVVEVDHQGKVTRWRDYLDTGEPLQQIKSALS